MDKIQLAKIQAGIDALRDMREWFQAEHGGNQLDFVPNSIAGKSFKRMNEAIAGLEELSQLKALPDGWRPIEEAPRDGTRFLAHEPGCSHAEVMMWDLEHWFDEEGYIREPASWQPLPAPPHGVEK